MTLGLLSIGNLFCIFVFVTQRVQAHVLYTVLLICLAQCLNHVQDATYNYVYYSVMLLKWSSCVALVLVVCSDNGVCMLHFCCAILPEYS